MSVEARTVQISSLSPATTKESLSSFVGFCGAIESLHIIGTTATVVFAKESAAKTAELLNGASLDGSELTIASSSFDGHEHKDDAHLESAELEQEHKPRSAVVAELLAHGYVLSDKSVQTAIELDNKYGISSRFLAFFRPLHQQATATAKQLDAQAHITEKATTAAAKADDTLHVKETTSKVINIGKQYYEQALKSPFGSKVFNFYTLSAKQVQDVHEEAKRIAESKKVASPTVGSTPTLPSSDIATANDAALPTAGSSDIKAAI